MNLLPRRLLADQIDDGVRVATPEAMHPKALSAKDRVGVRPEVPARARHHDHSRIRHAERIVRLPPRVNPWWFGLQPTRGAGGVIHSVTQARSSTSLERPSSAMSGSSSIGAVVPRLPSVTPMMSSSCRVLWLDR